MPIHPLIADETCLRARAIPALAGAQDGINGKLDKAGGILPADRMIAMAGALGMKTLLGCMLSGFCSVTAAAHHSPPMDYADLDGNLLFPNHRYSVVPVEKGKPVLPGRPGLRLKTGVPEIP